MSEAAMELTDATFKKGTAKGVVLVDFWAPWCGPCRMMGPIIDRLATQTAGKAIICKMNVDENTQVAGELGISGIPALVLFKDGKEIDRFVGVQAEADLLAAIEKAQ